MKPTIIQKKFATKEEYFLFEEQSELKHEYVNGNLIEMSGVSKYHNKITLQLAVLLQSLLRGTDFEIFVDGFKVKNPESNFFYPDIIVSEANPEKYYTEQPVLIAEVLSESTRKFDLTDKFIQYQKIPTLYYYLCIEPEQQVVIFYFKNNENEWLTETYTKDEDTLQLPQLNIAISLKEIYKP